MLDDPVAVNAHSHNRILIRAAFRVFTKPIVCFK